MPESQLAPTLHKTGCQPTPSRLWGTTQNPSGPGDTAGRGEEGGHRGGHRGEGRSLSATQAELLLHHFLVQQLTSFSAASLNVSQDPEPWFLVAANSECRRLTSRTGQGDGA